MPNWCINIIKIYSENRYKLEELEKLLNEWTSKNYADNGFGECWLGNIVIGSGIGTIDKNEDSDLSCRGALLDIELFDDFLWIETQTAWNPMIRLWVRLLEKYVPDAKLIYYADEFGGDVFCSNDPHMKDVYYLQLDDIDLINEVLGYDIDDFMDGNEIKEIHLKKCLQILLDTDEDDIDTLINLIEESQYEDEVYILKCEIIDPEDLN